MENAFVRLNLGILNVKWTSFWKTVFKVIYNTVSEVNFCLDKMMSPITRKNK